MFLRKLTLSGLWCLYRKEELIFKPPLPTARRMASNIGIARLKPPNILIQETNDNQKEQLIQMFERVLLRDQYVVYGISSDLLAGSKSWIDNTQLLVIHQKTKHLTDILRRYLEGGGKLLYMRSESEEEAVEFVNHEHCHACSENIEDDTLKNILSEKFSLKLSPETVRVPESSCGYLVTGEDTLRELLRRRSDPSDLGASLIRQSEVTLDFDPTQRGQPSPSYIPVRPGVECEAGFDSSLYLSHLVTRRLGRILVYIPCMSSSMAVFQGRPLMDGFTVVPGRQMAGLGRGGNKWLSPPGCSMFSLQISLDLESFLGRRPSLIQHLVALAHVDAVRSLSGYEDVDLRIKWPNDIYYGAKNKIGGVLLKSSVIRDKIIVTIGAGTNLNNEYPTVSINQILRENGHEVLDQEVFLARTLNSLEKLVEKCSLGQFSQVESLYYRYWLHGGQQIRVWDKDTEQRVTVLGIDEFGFLRVKGTDDSVFSVMDDGNSFDMMQGLVKPKLR